MFEHYRGKWMSGGQWSFPNLLAKYRLSVYMSLYSFNPAKVKVVEFIVSGNVLGGLS